MFGLLAVLYSLATRLKYGPDEPAHFIYIRSIATRFDLPPISRSITPDERSTATHEGHQPPLYYALMAIPFALMHLFGAGDETIWRVLRLANIPLGLVWIWLVYVLALEYFGRKWQAIATAGFVAGIPTASYMAGVINNENLITLLFTWALIPILRYFRGSEMSDKDACLMGVLIGLSILTKAQGMVLLFMLVLAAAGSMLRSRGLARRDSARVFLLSLGSAILVCGWWFVRNKLVHGTAVPQSLYNPVVPGGLMALASAPSLGAELIYRISLALYGYFWTPFWIVWPFVGSLRQVVYPIAAVNAVVLAGAIARIRRLERVDLESLVFLLIAPVMIYILWLQYILTVDQMANLQGRLFLSVAGVFGILWVIGFEGLLRSRRARLIGAVVMACILLAGNAGVIWCACRLYCS